MNPFATSGDQRSLAEAFGRFLRDANEFTGRRERLSGSAPDRCALWPSFAEQGVIAAAFGESHGGFAGDVRTIAVLMNEIGVALAVEPYLATAVVAGRIMQHWADRAAGQAAIDAIIAGKYICVLAHNGFGDPFAWPGVEAASGSGSRLISGFIPAVRHAELAQTFLVPARLADGSMEIYRIEPGHPGLTIEPFRAIDAAGAANLRFQDVRIPDSQVVPVDTSCREVIDEALELAIVGLAAEATGIVYALNAATFTHLMTRKQFGTVIGSFQALQHRAADMWISAEELLAIVDVGIETVASPRSAARDAIISAVKVVADKTGRRVANEAVQLHGGMGVSDELIVSHYFRRLAAIRSELGSTDAHRLRFRSKQ